MTLALSAMPQSLQSIIKDKLKKGLVVSILLAGVSLPCVPIHPSDIPTRKRSAF